MTTREIFSQNLIIESDVQDFAAHVIEATEELGGHRLAVVARLGEFIGQVRGAGAGRGCPVRASLLLSHTTLLIRWGESAGVIPLISLPRLPAPLPIERLVDRLHLATQVTEPAQLLARNHEMAVHFEATRRDLRSEIQAMQLALDQRQTELRASMHAAETDPLTGLFNRRAFDHRIEHAFRRVARQCDEVLALLLLDLDEFKKLNDTYGHPYGDEYLRRMARTMQSVIRADVDAAFRIGGDEFAILLSADCGAACRKAMQILSLMDGRVSIGVACKTGQTAGQTGRQDSVERFFETADSALYESKHTGRGRVTIDICRQRGNSGCQSPCTAETISS